MLLSRRPGLGRDGERWRAEGPLSRKQRPAEVSGILRPWTPPALGVWCAALTLTRPRAPRGPGEGNVLRGAPSACLAAAPHSAQRTAAGLLPALPPPPQGPGRSQWPLWLQPLLFRGASPTPSLPQEREILRAALARLSPPRPPFSVPTPRPGTRKHRSYDITLGAAGPQSCIQPPPALQGGELCAGPWG